MYNVSVMPSTPPRSPPAESRQRSKFGRKLFATPVPLERFVKPRLTTFLIVYPARQPPVFIAVLPEKLRSTLAAEGASRCWGGPVFPKKVCASEQPQITLRDTAMCCKSCSMCRFGHLLLPGLTLIEPHTTTARVPLNTTTTYNPTEIELRSTVCQSYGTRIYFLIKIISIGFGLPVATSDGRDQRFVNRLMTHTVS